MKAKKLKPTAARPGAPPGARARARGAEGVGYRAGRGSVVSQIIKLDTLTATSDTTDNTSERDCLRHVELGRGPAFLALNGHR